MKCANETQRAHTKVNKTRTPPPKTNEQWFQQHQETPQKILWKVNITFSSLKFIVSHTTDYDPSWTENKHRGAENISWISSDFFESFPAVQAVLWRHHYPKTG